MNTTANKAAFYSELAQRATAQVKEEWPSFLDTAARMYKYPFSDQLMIYAQRPEATACASFDLWNNVMNRMVKRGSKGIALMDSQKPSGLRYVFDVTDTVAGRSARSVNLWNLKQEHEGHVLQALSDSYGETADSLPNVFDRISQKLSDEYFNSNHNDIREAMPDITEHEFRDIVAESVSYAIHSRCGLQADFTGDLPARELTPDGVRALGNAVSVLSEQVLRGIEIAVKQYGLERDKKNERSNRTDLSPGGGRGLFDSRPDRAGTATPEQVRADARGLSENPSADSIQRTAADRQTAGISRVNQPDGGRTHGTADGRIIKEKPAAGQSNQPDGMGRTHEQPESAGGRNRSRGTGLQLSLFGTEPLNTKLDTQTAIETKSVEIALSDEKAEPAPTVKEPNITTAVETKPAETTNKEKYTPKIGDWYRIQGRLYKADDVRENIVTIRDVTYDRNTIFPTTFDVTVEYLNQFKPLTKQELEQPIPFYNGYTQPEAVAPAIADTPSQEHTPALDITERPEALTGERINFRITDMNLGEGGAKTKYGFNSEAIRTLKQIEAENRHATPEEQNTLSRYVGWGGLPQAFDGEKAQWSKEYAELKSLLTDDEYESARSSTLNAYYTSPVVIQAMYETIERMGFKKGNILEPSCGVGNFIGMLPDSMRDSKVYGVELDGITGRIAQKLYPNADIHVKGFEKLDTPDAMFDLAIGNVPFGAYGVADRRYDRHRFHIHDYFFAKTLDQIRPGGVVAFITSHGTLDKQSTEMRRYVAQRAELLGAVRLPNNAFQKNAGTEVTTDIIFLQKRERQMDVSPDWINRELMENDIPVNSYFAKNPEMILGRMERGDKLYGDNPDSTTCHPIEGADLSAQLREALSHIEGFISEPELDAAAPDAVGKSIPADPNIRNFSYAVIDNTVYFRENSRMNPVEAGTATLERIKGMAALRDCTRELIDYQLNSRSDYDIHQKQTELNSLYDSFTAKHGLINATANKRAFSEDSSYYLLASLEIVDEHGKLSGKADMFTKRTIQQRNIVTSVDTASEALAVSIAEKARVDLPYMSNLAGFTEEKIIHDLEGVIFRDLKATSASGNFEEIPFVAADEYLSGNVREKLRMAKFLSEILPPEHTAAIAPNISALEEAQPKDLDASEISVRLGSTWIGKGYVEQFAKELLQVQWHPNHFVNYSEHSGEWNVQRRAANHVLTGVTYGTSRVDAFKIIEDTLNLRDVRVFDTFTDANGNKRSELNKNETTKAQQKQEAVKQAFKDWIFKDPERRQDLVKTYNEKFNSTRPREYNGQHLNFAGINPEITLRQHQLNTIARVLYGGNTLMAHVVGAGKTYSMAAAAMEAKRLGICQKSLFAVPSHLTEQWGEEFLRLYPSANILVATAKDFETGNRKKFCAKIATGDYDAVIIGHSQLEKIPMSKERQARLLREQIDEIAEGVSELKHSRGDRFSVKQLEKTKNSLEVRLTRLMDESRKDDVVTFEQLGCDRLFVDEAHSFKNLFLYTKMRNVAGLSQTEAQKSSDLFMKCRYMDELTGGKGVIFATGTPVSNSMTEMYTMQRYLQYDALEQQGLKHFDSWASTFGETVTAIELAPEGTGYRARTRFARFHNLPELMGMFKDVADIKTADMLNLPRPEAHYHTVVVKPSELQQEMVKELSARAALVHNKKVEPDVDNMLKITSDGRKIGLDQRLINPLLPDHPESKVNTCAENVFNIWEKTAAARLTQLVFCDFSTPNADGRFNVYDDIKGKLIERGVPEKEIAFIHDANTEARKKELFEKVRQGTVRVLFGSTFKMGSGTNVQDRLIHLHDLDCPWRPSDLEQRAGRIVRQGNMNPEVHITRYVTEGTFDAYLYQTIENKQKFVSQIMTSKVPLRSCEDIDEAVLSYAEIKALCAGNPLIKEKMDLDIEVARLKLLKAEHQCQCYRLEDYIIRTYPTEIESAKERIAGLTEDMERLKAETVPNKDGFSPMNIVGTVYTEKAEAGQKLLDVCKTVVGREPTRIGAYRGFDMYLHFDAVCQSCYVTFKGTMHHLTSLGTDVHGNITRLNNLLEGFPNRLTAAQQQIEDANRQMETAKEELTKPFPQEAELAAKAERLVGLDATLNLDAAVSAEMKNEPENEIDLENDGLELENKQEASEIAANMGTRGVSPAFSDEYGQDTHVPDEAEALLNETDYDFDEIADFHDDSPNENEASVKEIIKSEGLIKTFNINEHIVVCTIPAPERNHPTEGIEM